MTITTTGRGRGRRFGGFAMKTMTRPAAEAHRPAAARDLPAARRAHLANRPGRSSQVRLLTWSFAAGAAAIVAFAEPALLPWLLLPVAPALLLRAAGCEDDSRCGPRVMRLFSVAALAAVLF